MFCTRPATLPIYQVFGTRHPDTDPSVVRAPKNNAFSRSKRKEASSSWVSDRHVRAPRSLEAKPEGLAGGRSPAGTVAPADVAIVRRCSISFHDGFRRKARKANVSRRSTRKPNPKRNTRLFGSSLLTDARLSVPRLFFFRRRKKDGGASREDRRAVFFCARARFPRRKKVPGPSHQAAARGFDPATRRSSARRAKRAYTGPSGKEDLLSSFRCGVAWKRRGDSFWVFFSPSSTRKKTQTRSAAAPRRALCRDDNTRGCLLVG